MKKYIIGIPIIILVIFIATYLFLACKPLSQLNIDARNDICVLIDDSSSYTNAHIEALVSKISSETVNDYKLVDFTGM